MREKQRIADLKKQGIDPTVQEEPKKKEYDMSFMAKYEVPEEEETKEATKPQDDLEETKEATKPMTAKQRLLMSQLAALEAKQGEPALGGQK